MTEPSKISIEVLETLLRVEQDLKDDAIARILAAPEDELHRTLATLGLDPADVQSIVRESLRGPGKEQPQSATSTDHAEALKNAQPGWKVVTGKPGSARRVKPRADRQPLVGMPPPTSMPMSSSIPMGANRFGNKEAALAIGKLYKENITIAGRNYSAYVDVSAENEIILQGAFEADWSCIVLFGQEYPLIHVTGYDDARRCAGVGRLLFSDALEAAQQDPEKAAIILR